MELATSSTNLQERTLLLRITKIYNLTELEIILQNPKIELKIDKEAPAFGFITQEKLDYKLIYKLLNEKQEPRSFQACLCLLDPVKQYLFNRGSDADLALLLRLLN